MQAACGLRVQRACPAHGAYRHAADPESAQLQTPSLQLETADPVAYLERHEAALGHNARNVMHIAAEVDWLPQLAAL